MIYLLGGYMWLFIHRPFEFWMWLGPLRLERIYMAVLLIVWATTAPKRWLSNRLHLPLFGLVAAVVAAWLASAYMDQGSLVVEDFLKVVVFFVVVVTSVRDEKSLRQVVLFYLIAANIYQTHSILEFINGRCEYRMGITRMIGVDFTYAEPNEFAASLLFTLPFAWALWSARGATTGLRRFLIWHGLGVVFCILLTGSRAGFAAMGACGMLLLMLSRQKKGMILLVAVAAGCVAIVLPGPLQNRFLTIFDSSYGPANANVSAASRLDGLLLGIQIWQDSFLFGHGPNSFQYVTKRGLGAHNVYGQVLSETGFLGALAFLSVLLCFWLNAREARKLHRLTGARPDDLAYLVARAVGVNVLLLMLCGWAGHNLLRYNWLWFAAWQIVAVHCLRMRLSANVAIPARSASDWRTPRIAWAPG